MIRFGAFFLVLCLACACAPSAPARNHETWLARRGLPLPTQDSFVNCRGNGCRKMSTLSLSERDRREIDALFEPPSRDAAQERARIGEAIGLLERSTGALTGALADKAGTFGSFGANQTDCVDEATNSTIYLSLLEQRGHLRFHAIRGPAVRLPLLSGTGWPHTTAVITEKSDGADYAVDSWFEDGGKPAHVVALSEWSGGWSPWVRRSFRDDP